MQSNDLDTLRTKLQLSDDLSGPEVVRLTELYLLLTVHIKTTTINNKNMLNNISQDQLEMGMLLATYYKYGHSELGIPQDPRKAKFYANENNDAGDGKKTQRLYNSFGWFNAIRLFTVRFMRVVRFSGIILKQSVFKNASILTSIGGLSYGIEILIDCGVILKSTFANTQEGTDDVNGTYWQRFIAVLRKDNRPYRLANALVWFSVNLACFFLSGGMSAILNTALFAFDICNDAFKAWRKISDAKKLNNLINTHVDNDKNNKKNVLLQKLAREQLKSIRREHILQVFTTMVVFTGMVFIFFPPPVLITVLGLAGIHMLGACFTLAGSVFGGLGKRLYNRYIESKLPMATPIHFLDEAAIPTNLELPAPVNDSRSRTLPKNNSLLSISKNTSHIRVKPLVRAGSYSELQQLRFFRFNPPPDSNQQPSSPISRNSGCLDSNQSIRLHPAFPANS